jgi:hypothetical protein
MPVPSFVEHDATTLRLRRIPMTTTTDPKVVNLKKQARKQSPADRPLKLKRGIDALLPLATPYKDIEELLLKARELAFEKHTKAEMKLPELGN